MLKKDVLSHFDGVVKVSDLLGVSAAAVSQWGDIIPEKQALKLEKLTEDKLKYNPALYKK